MPRASRPSSSRVRACPGAVTAAALLLLAIPALAAPGAARAQDSVSVGPVTLHWWPGQERLAAGMEERLRQQATLPALPATVLSGADINVYLAPDEARWDSLTGGQIPEWGAGVANPETGLIVLPAYDWARTPPHTVFTTLRHELAHVALQRYVGPSRTPRWFTEGYAQWAAGEWRWEAAWRLRLAFLGQRAPSLDSLSLVWPVGESDARLAYLLSASAVAYLAERSGERGLRIFLERWQESLDFDGAFRGVYGLTISQFEEDWRTWVKRRYGWAVLLGQTAVFWLVAAVLLVVMVIIRRRRDRARMARLRTAEPPDDPAYWETQSRGRSVEPPEPSD